MLPKITLALSAGNQKQRVRIDRLTDSDSIQLVTLFENKHEFEKHEFESMNLKVSIKLLL